MGILSKRLEPQQGYALFFPSRKEERIVIGKPTMIRRWPQEDFKQVQLGEFSITTSFGPNLTKPLARTLDNLPCKAKVEFILKISEEEKALEEATRTCSVTTDVKVAISHEFFKKKLQIELEAIVESCIRKVKYLDLLTTPAQEKKAEKSPTQEKPEAESLEQGKQSPSQNKIPTKKELTEPSPEEKVKEDESHNKVAKLEEEIRSEADQKVKQLGFILVYCQADIEVLELDDGALAQNPGLEDSWNAYQTAKKTTEVETKRREQAHTNSIKVVERQGKIEEDKIESEYLINKDNILKTKDAQIRKRANEDLGDVFNKKSESANIQRSIDKIDEDFQIGKEQVAHNLATLKLKFKIDLEKDEKNRRYEMEKEELTRQASLAEIKRREEAKKKQDELEGLRNEIELDKLKVQKAELQRSIAELESKRIEIIGKAQAEADREKTLAAHAHTMKMNESLLNALPAILEKAYAPTEKLGEVKVLYLGGRNTDVSGKHQPLMEQTLGAILSSMSTIPMIKEAMRFIKDWELPFAEGSEPRQDRIISNKKQNQESSEELDSVAPELNTGKK